MTTTTLLIDIILGWVAVAFVLGAGKMLGGKR